MVKLAQLVENERYALVSEEQQAEVGQVLEHIHIRSSVEKLTNQNQLDMCLHHLAQRFQFSTTQTPVDGGIELSFTLNSGVAVTGTGSTAAVACTEAHIRCSFLPLAE